MAALVLTALGFILVADAVLIAGLAGWRASADPEAMREGAAFAGVFLAAGALCLIAAGIAA